VKARRQKSRDGRRTMSMGFLMQSRDGDAAIFCVYFFGKYILAESRQRVHDGGGA
jgi:hypothetical protein